MNRLKCNQVVCIPKSDPIILYKKLGFDMHSPYQFFKYVIGKTYFVKEFNENVHRSCTKNRIYSIPKSELAKWAGSRYFKVHVWGKCILEKKNKVGSEYLKIIEELKPKEFVKYMSSIGAYLYCEIVKDIKTVRDRINGPFEAYLYCKNVKDRKKIRDLIKDSYYAYSYCKNVKDRKDMRDKITDSMWAYSYCTTVKDRKEIRDRITSPTHRVNYKSYLKFEKAKLSKKYKDTI